MTLLFFFKCVSDFSVFFALGNYVAYACGGKGIPIFVGLLPAVTLFLCSLLSEKRPKLRAFPLLLLLPGVFLLHHGGDWAVYLFACCYCALLCKKQLFAQSYTDARMNLSRSCLILLALPFFSMISGGLAVLSRLCAPYVLLFLGASVLQTRMLRHDARTLQSRGFLFKNLLALVGVCAISLAASNQRFLLMLRTVVKALYRAIIFPILMLLAYAAAAIAWLGGKLFSFFNPNFVPNELKPQEIAQAIGTDGIEYKQITGMDPRVEAVILTLIGLMVAGLLGLLLYKLVAAHRRRPPEVAFSDTRERLEAHSAPRRQYFAPRDPQKAVRHYYRRFLEDCRAKGIPITPDNTTEEIARRAADSFDAEAVSSLRRLYLAARYSPKPVTRQVAKEAKEAYNRIIRNEEKTKEETL